MARAKAKTHTITDDAMKGVHKLLADAPGWIDRGVTATVLSSVAVLEDALEGALLSHMRPATAKMRSRLFNGYGPLSSLAARIDVAYAFNILTQAEYDALAILRSVRNKFAHGQKAMTFDDEEIATAMKKLKCSDPAATDDYKRYFATLFGICSRLVDDMERSDSPNIVPTRKDGSQ